MKIEHGFTLVELLVATAVTLCATAALLAVASPARIVSAGEAESADMQQRLRVAHTVLFEDLIVAGAGTDFGSDRGPLTDFFAAILPYHQARAGGDAPGTFRTDAVTLMYVPTSKAQATIAEPQPSRSGTVHVNIAAGCSLNDAACGFTQARLAVVFGATGSFDVFKVTAVDGSLLYLEHRLEDSAAVHPAGSRIVQAVVRSYYPKVDPATGAFQLVRDDGDGGPIVPVIDHVVGLAFEYFGAARPPRMRRSRWDPDGPWTTYGPRPPAPGEQPTLYPPGENCVFTSDGSGVPVPRLPTLDAVLADGPVPLTMAELTDGPWCPDAAASPRFDADLLRIRSVAVTLRVESAIDAFRGPAGALFSRPGTSSVGGRLLPDQEIRFLVSPRNLDLLR
jgi:prepilin-type N-terminal cleavage/methylation domain-containing protein